MAQFRKKPVVIEAWQWFCNGHAPTGPGIRECGTHVEIDTLEGVMRADPGDWIIREPFPTPTRQFYPCKPEIFAATYEPATPDRSA